MSDSITNQIQRAQRTIDGSRKTLATLTYDATLNSTTSSVPITTATLDAVLDSTGAIATDCSKGNSFTTTFSDAGATGKLLANPTNIAHGVEYTWRLTQGVGDTTLSYGTWFRFVGGTPPTLSTGTGDLDILKGTAIKIGSSAFVIYTTAELDVA